MMTSILYFENKELVIIDVIDLISNDPKLIPIISGNTCDQTGMLDIPYGQGKSLMHGAVYK